MLTHQQTEAVPACTCAYPCARLPAHLPTPHHALTPPAQVLHASDVVLLLWSLALLRCTGTRLYRHAAFRTSRLPAGVPRAQAQVAMLLQVAALATAQGAPAADTVLPEWLAAAGAAASRADTRNWAAAEALRDGLHAAGLGGAAVKRLGFGECVVLLPLPRGGQAAILPWWEAGRAANAPAQPLGSSLIADLLLGATGMRVLLAGPDLSATVAACTALR